MRNLLLHLSLLLLLLGAGVADREPCLVLRISFRCVAGAKPLRLRQVVRVEQDPSGVWPLVSEVILPAETGSYLHRGTILRRLRDAGLPEFRICVRGPAFCKIERSQP
ncbi:MAG: hypothetical protein V3T77_07305 [Planctomycetota bacterium]